MMQNFERKFEKLNGPVTPKRDRSEVDERSLDAIQMPEIQTSPMVKSEQLEKSRNTFKESIAKSRSNTKNFEEQQDVQMQKDMLAEPRREEQIDVIGDLSKDFLDEPS
jgi:hypothetical protein